MELNLIERKGIFYADSREVAEMTEKEHAHLMRDIKGYEIVLSENPNLDSQDFFVPNTYKVAGNNKTYPCYLITRLGCDMVANKMTGEKGILFTAAYVMRFAQMEKQLQQPVTPIPNLKQQEVEARLRNARVRESNQYLKIAAQIDIPEYKYILQSKAAETLAGTPILPMQEAKQKTYSATDIGNMFGVSKKKIGAVANANNLKTPEYGKLFYTKSEHSVKEVETWRYYENAIPVFAKLLGKEVA